MCAFPPPFFIEVDTCCIYLTVKPSPMQPVAPTGFGVVMLHVQDNSLAGKVVQVPFKLCYQAMM